jgi:hypothetical protein
MQPFFDGRLVNPLPTTVMVVDGFAFAKRLSKKSAELLLRTLRSDLN